MSPEQKVQDRGSELDGRADLYSLGVILFQMLTRRLPEDGAGPSDLNPEAPRQIDFVFKRCTAPLEERPKGDDILAELQELAREETVVLGREADGDADVSEATTVFISRKPAKMPAGVIPATRRTDTESGLPMIALRENAAARMVPVPSD